MTTRTFLASDHLQQLLQRCSEFRRVEAGIAEKLRRHAVLERHVPGDMLWRQGEAVAAVFIPGGLVRISMQDSKGLLFTTSLVHACHVLGEAEILAGHAQRFNEACVLLPQDVVRIPAADFQHCIDASPALMRAWLRWSNQRFLLALLHGHALAQHTAEQRLYWLANLLQRYTPAQADGTVRLSCTQEVLSTMAALSRQATARVITDWRRRGLVDTHYQCLRILQPSHFQGDAGATS